MINTTHTVVAYLNYKNFKENGLINDLKKMKSWLSLKGRFVEWVKK